MLRRSECVIIAYLIWAAGVAAALPVRPPVRPVTLVLNLTILACYALLAYADSLRRRPFLGIIRDWFSVPAAAARLPRNGLVRSPFTGPRTGNPMGRVGPAGPGRRRARRASNCWARWCRPCSKSPTPWSMCWGPFRSRCSTRIAAGTAWTGSSSSSPLGVLLCYAQFPFWPSEPPRTVFPGEDFPSYDTVFRRFNWWMLGGYGIHTSVFPSAHVAGAFSAALGMWFALPERRWVAWFLFVMAVLIATATVYGRYHYLADAAAGLVMAVLALVFTRALAIYRKAGFSGSGADRTWFRSSSRSWIPSWQSRT